MYHFQIHVNHLPPRLFLGVQKSKIIDFEQVRDELLKLKGLTGPDRTRTQNDLFDLMSPLNHAIRKRGNRSTARVFTDDDMPGADISSWTWSMPPTVISRIRLLFNVHNDTPDLHLETRVSHLRGDRTLLDEFMIKLAMWDAKLAVHDGSKSINPRFAGEIAASMLLRRAGYALTGFAKISSM